jgi:hypothetical protein
VIHAVLKPASARPKAARRPAPPAPLQSALVGVLRGRDQESMKRTRREHRTHAQLRGNCRFPRTTWLSLSRASPRMDYAPENRLHLYRLSPGRAGSDEETRGGGTTEAPFCRSQRTRKSFSQHPSTPSWTRGRSEGEREGCSDIGDQAISAPVRAGQQIVSRA